jgi:hypothetical protein
VSPPPRNSRPRSWELGLVSPPPCIWGRLPELRLPPAVDDSFLPDLLRPPCWLTQLRGVPLVQPEPSTKIHSAPSSSTTSTRSGRLAEPGTVRKRESSPNLTESSPVSDSVSGSMNRVRGTNHCTPNLAAMIQDGWCDRGGACLFFFPEPVFTCRGHRG